MKSRPKKGEAAALIKAVTGLEKGAKLLFIFGPEGGLSPAEIEILKLKELSWQALVFVFCEQKQHHFTLYQPLVFY